MSIRHLTAGESHGPNLTAIVEGFPAGLPITEDYINKNLRRRQMGYGRGGRMVIETDACNISSGVRHGATLGSPITLSVLNRDWTNWTSSMSIAPLVPEEMPLPITKPRPGHADLPGVLKYGHEDVRNVLERASARETASRVAVGSLALRMLEELGVTVASHVTSIGSIGEGLAYDFWRRFDEHLESDTNAADASPVRCLDSQLSDSMIEEIERTKAQGDSLGGTFEVLAFGLPPGLGSYVHWDRRLDARLAYSVMSIQAVKGVELGLGFASAHTPGSGVHDEIRYDETRGYFRSTNHCGGVEGGMSNGETLVVRVAMKPIPTLYQPLMSVDLVTKEPFKASIERSDVCAVPAAAVVAEAAIAWVLVETILEKFGGDSLTSVKTSLNSYVQSLGGAWIHPRDRVR